jgi:predicted homoserine dehydrogenase-like protein
VIDRDLQRLEDAGTPIRVGLVGAGYIGVPAAVQLIRHVPGIRVAAIASHQLADAGRAYQLTGQEKLLVAETASQVNQGVYQGQPVIARDGLLLAQSDEIDVILDLTANIEGGAALATSGITNGKHVIGYNAELSATLGPILKHKADQAGVVITEADGDQPGVLMNLYRFIEGMGMRPVLCGNIKGLEDHYRTPETQKSFAAKWGQKAHMVTSFADGTKISFEQAVIANATDMRVAKRGMIGLQVTSGLPVEDAAMQFDADMLLAGQGIVDYVIGAAPAPGVFILAASDDPLHQQFMRYYKMGEGPLYCFTRPYHLCHLEIAGSIARAALYGDATITPRGALQVEVVATAKRNLHPGDTLDGIGKFMLYGQCENADVVKREDLLPMGLAEGAVVSREIARDEVLRTSDVQMPPERLLDRLRQEQDAYFGN